MANSSAVVSDDGDKRVAVAAAVGVAVGLTDVAVPVGVTEGTKVDVTGGPAVGRGIQVGGGSVDGNKS
jgi:hypothetical protein